MKFIATSPLLEHPEQLKRVADNLDESLFTSYEVAPRLDEDDDDDANDLERLADDDFENVAPR
jgi:hypothetical protein